MIFDDTLIITLGWGATSHTHVEAAASYPAVAKIINEVGYTKEQIFDVGDRLILEEDAI